VSLNLLNRKKARLFVVMAVTSSINSTSICHLARLSRAFLE
jgi:hypothetical protein